jgi:uncharacterized membrane protein YraQ (UPF0718 family)
MKVNPANAFKAAKAGKEYFFCSRHCRDLFIAQEGPVDAETACAACGRRPVLQNKLVLITCAIVLLIMASYVVSFLVPLRNALLMYLRSIWWAVLAGLLLGGIIDHYIPREYIAKVLSRDRPQTVLNAVFLGFLMSACSHGILALSIQLHKKGASNPAIVSFLLASPWANMTVTVMLLAFFGPKALCIILGAILIAINTGLIFMWLQKKGWIEKNTNSITVAQDFSIVKDIRTRMSAYRFGWGSLAADLKGVLQGAWALADMVLWWILLGLCIASIAASYIPVHFFHQFMGPTLLGLTVTLALATVIEVCSEGSSPLAFEIYRQTGALGNSFVFLMAGVVTDYTEIGLLWTNVGRRTALWLPVVTVPQVLVLGYLANIIFR